MQPLSTQREVYTWTSRTLSSYLLFQKIMYLSCQHSTSISMYFYSCCINGEFTRKIKHQIYCHIAMSKHLHNEKKN